MNQHPGYRPEIDGLRCIAVMSVILFHAGLPGFRGGFTGVDIFFVISGYLITGIILGELRRGTFTFRRFYERRVRRIFPALALVLIVTTAAAWFILTPGQYKAFGQSLLACTVFLSNLYFLLKTDYFARQAEELPLLHTWSLSVEEQFYVVFPAVLFAVFRWFPRRLSTVLGIGAFLSFALCLHRQSAGSDQLNFFDTSSRAWQLLAGAWLASGDAREPGVARDAVTRIPRELMALSGLFMVVAPIAFLDPKGSQFGWQMSVPVVGAMLLLRWAKPDTWAGSLLSSKVAVAVGLVSYSAYLWHQPLFALAVAWYGNHPPTGVVLSLVALTLALAYASWRFVETPFRDRERVSSRSAWSLMIVGSAVLASAGLALHLSGGVPARFSDQQNAAMASSAPSPMRGVCHTEGVAYLKPAEACRFIDRASVHWAVLGDSHGVELSYALALRLREQGAGGVLQLSASGCQPALEFESAVPGCTAWLREALATLIADRDITHVALIWRHSFYLYGEHRMNYPAVPAGKPNFLVNEDPQKARTLYTASLDKIVDTLARAGKHVYLIDPVPELPRPAEYYVYSPSLGDSAELRATGAPVTYYQARNQYILDALARIAESRSVTRVQTRPLYCGDRICRVTSDGGVSYFDDNHLSVSGAGLLAQRLLSLASDPSREPR